MSVFFLLFSFPVFASAENPARVIDNAELISSEDESVLKRKISEIEAKYGVNLVILTENEISGTVVSYADNYYDKHGYSTDGVLLLISMAERDWYISTAGKCILWLTDYGIEEIGDEFVSYLSDGEYYDGFDEYLRLLDRFFLEGSKGKPFDVDHGYKSAGDYFVVFAGASVVGLVVAFAVVFSMKRKMKTSVMQPAAGQYVKNREFNLSVKEDRFLYSTVSKTAIPKDTGSSGGSSTHTSSSGSTHGGGGGKF